MFLQFPLLSQLIVPGSARSLTLSIFAALPNSRNNTQSSFLSYRLSEAPSLRIVC